jgi:hypothetical protein
MKKQLLIVSSYPSTDVGEKMLQSVLERVNSHFDVLLVTHCPVSKEVQNMVKYFVYDCRNDLIPSNPNVNFYADYPKFFFRIYQSEKHKNHSYAILRSIMNAINFAEDSYDSFVCMDGDSLFSEDDVVKLQNLKSICDAENKQALFFKFDYVLAGTMFYSKISFFKNTFSFAKSPEEYIENCKKVGSYGTFENFLYKSIEYKKAFDELYTFVNLDIIKYFTTSTFGLSTFVDGEVVTDSAAVSTVLKIENTQEIAFVYLNKNKGAKESEIYVDDVFYETIPAGVFGRVFKINPEKNEFTVRVGNKRLLKFNKDSILDQKNKSFVRLK